jgi:transcriptional regulator with XRE-family HTH domain
VVGFIERAEREPGVSLLWRMADGLGIPISELLQGLGPSTTRVRGRRS